MVQRNSGSYWHDTLEEEKELRSSAQGEVTSRHERSIHRDRKEDRVHGTGDDALAAVVGVPGRQDHRQRESTRRDTRWCEEREGLYPLAERKKKNKEESRQCERWTFDEWRSGSRMANNTNAVSPTL